MHISLEAIMSDYKEWQRKKAAMNGAIERYTEERMTNEIKFGAGGGGGAGLQSVLSPCPHCCGRQTGGGGGTGLQPVVIREGMAACTDRIGGAGVVTHGVVGVATQSDAEITEADCNVAEYIAGDRARDLDYQVVAYHREWSVLEERAKIVAWLREQQTSTEKLRDEMNRHTAGWRFADEHASSLEQSANAIERGEHIQEQSK